MPMTSPTHYCANCGKQYQHHVEEKCPFEACTFQPIKEFHTYEMPGVGVGNLGAVKKIKFFDSK